MEEKHWSEQTCYRTGFTQPKPTKRGPIAILLVLVIFFGGLNTLFRLLNIRLFREITQDAAIASSSVQFSGHSRIVENNPVLPVLGLTGKEISPFEQQCYGLPSGFYITAVTPGSPAEKAGIQAGDILLYCNDTPANNLTALKKALHTAKDSFKLKLHRTGTEFSAVVCLE